ncbi:MAG: dihydrofolate reductase family protein [Clostridia bacterium]|nr:dihydrofolate reductase family protein [Clostridia bacterium]
MNRPYIICHMVTSLDGKVTGEFLSKPECADACEIYYDINRKLKSDGFICGRITMEGSFTEGYYPDLSEYEPVHHDLDLKMDFITDDLTGFYAVAFDPKGRLGWKSNKIIDPDGDPGYDGAQIIEVLTEQVDERYLGYLESMEIPYIFAGENEIDVDFALFKLKNIIGCETLLLEGGSIINGSFQRADVIDEISLVTAPIVADKNDKPLFTDSTVSNFELVKSEIINGNLVLNYSRKR